MTLDHRDAKALQYFAHIFWSWQEDAREAAGEAITLVFHVLVQAALLLAWLIQRDYYRIMAVILSYFCCLLLLPAGWVRKVISGSQE